MAWFTEEFEAFWRDLEKNNDRDWFQKNKKRFEQHVKKPFEAFIGDMILRMQAYDPECKIQPKDAIFRIHRDIRFSKDKTPYKTTATAIVGQGGRKEMALTGMYLELGHKHLRVYGGVYMPDKDQLFKIRQEILYNTSEFERLLNDKKFKNAFETIRGEQNKRLPPEFQEIAEKVPLIANKQFYYYTNLDPKLITSEKLIDAMYEAFEISIPMRTFLITPLQD